MKHNVQIELTKEEAEFVYLILQSLQRQHDWSANVLGSKLLEKLQKLLGEGDS